MSSRYTAYILLGIAAIVLCVAFVWRKAALLPSGPSASESVGGQKDANGCLIAAGYSWCAAQNTCIRSWERFCTAATPKEATFVCAEGKSIKAAFYPADDKYVDLQLSDGRNMSVPRAISASGARYARPDESFVFWNKGDTAFVTEGGKTTFADCALKASEKIGVPAVNDGSPQTVKAAIGRTVGALGIKLTPQTVVEDSRCPQDVQCIRAGTVRLRASLESGLGKADQTFELGKPVTTEAERITLQRVEPAKVSTGDILPSQYLFYFLIEKRGAGA